MTKPSLSHEPRQWPERKIEVSINRHFPGRKLAISDPRWAIYNSAFTPESHSAQILLEQVRRGHAFCSVLGSCQRDHCGQWCCAERRKANDLSHCGRPAGHRISWHFVSSQILALDFDYGNLSLDDLLADPFIMTYATFIYSTISSEPDNRKWRVVFILEEPITEAVVYCQAQTALLARFAASDQSIKDPARFLYGSNPETCVTHFLGNILPMAQVQELVGEFTATKRQSDAELERRSLPRITSSQVAGRTQSERYVNRAIQEELGWLESRAEGSGERHLGLLTVARRLESLRLSPWLDAEARAGIDVAALVLGAAERNGYVQKYGQADTMRAISWGTGVAEARPMPTTWELRRGGGPFGHRSGRPLPTLEVTI